MNDQRRKCEILEALHAEDDAWIIPNPWDVGSAIDLEQLGFKALATSSAAFAYTLGRQDGDVSLDEKLGHCEALSKGTDIPVSVDFEDGYAVEPTDIVKNIKLLAATGVAGCSIEDYSRQDKIIFDFNHSVERVQAAVEAVSDLDVPFQLTARSENLLRQHADLDDTIKRLQAYSAAGAHVLYAPGLSSLEQIALVKDNTDRPLNVLSPFLPGVSRKALSDAGATRISMGSVLQVNTRSMFIEAIKQMIADDRAS